MQDGRFLGEIDLNNMPDALLRRFEEYERLVNGQMFALLEDAEEQIDSLLLKVVLESGEEIAIEDLQIYPRSRRVSFRAKIPTIPLSDLGIGQGVAHPEAQPISE